MPQTSIARVDLFLFGFYNLFVFQALNHPWFPGINLASSRRIILWMHALMSLMRTTQWLTSFVIIFAMIAFSIRNHQHSIVLAEEWGFSESSGSCCRGGSESMDPCVSVPWFSQSLLYSETRCDQQPGAGPATGKIGVRSVDSWEERDRRLRLLGLEGR